MPRLRNDLTGAVMTVSEETAALLGSEWVDAETSGRSDFPDSTWKVADLKSYATDNGIDLGDATKKDDIVAAITAASDSGSSE